MTTLNSSVDNLSGVMGTPPATPPQPISTPGKLPRRSPRIIALPPLVFAASTLTGILIDAAARAPFVPGGHNPSFRIPVGALFVLAGLYLARRAKIHFNRAGTSAFPWRPTKALVNAGPYRWTRNPMYLGMAVASFGIALAAGSFYALLLLIPALVLVDRHAIRREEAFLTERFGDDYLAYRRTTRRWI